MLTTTKEIKYFSYRKKQSFVLVLIFLRRIGKENNFIRFLVRVKREKFDNLIHHEKFFFMV